MQGRILPLLLILAAAGVLSSVASRTPAQPREAYGPGYDPMMAVMREIRDELRGMRADMRAGPGGRPAFALADLIKSRCASCHSQSTAEDKGGGFIMVKDSGDVIDLRALEIKSAKGKVRRGEMPPGGGLPEQERKMFETLGEKK